ncbi:MAG: hypothetical protein J2P22_08260 [Nocardioides sp.]|nr:hypothetical protein [Nocardioides sp.]
MSTQQPTRYDDPSSKGLVALGVTGFAGVMLCVVAVFTILEGIAAIANDEVYVAGLHWAYRLDITGWGWIHLILGIIGLVVGIGILTGQTWARISGIVVAGLSCLANFAFLPYYPLWSIVILAFNALVIWALCTQLSGDANL